MHPSASLYMGKPFYVIFFLPLFTSASTPTLFEVYEHISASTNIFGSCDIVTDYVAFFPPQFISNTTNKKLYI